MQQLRPAVLHLAMQIHTTGTAQEASGLLFSVVLLDVNEPDVAATTRMVIDARRRVALVGVENLHAHDCIVHGDCRWIIVLSTGCSADVKILILYCWANVIQMVL